MNTLKKHLVLWCSTLLPLLSTAGEPETAEIHFDAGFTLGPNNKQAYPEWVEGIEEGGGYFNTSEKCWAVSESGAFGTGWLAVQLDRTNIVSDLAMVVQVNDYEGTDLIIQLYNKHGEVVAVDLFANLLETFEFVGSDYAIIPLSKYPDADSIVVRRLDGRVEITGLLLFPVIAEADRNAEYELTLLRQLGDKPSSSYYDFLRREDAHPGSGSTPSITPEAFSSDQLARLREPLPFTVFKYTDPLQPIDIYFIPLAGFPNDLAVELASELEGELNLKIKVSVHMGVSPKMFDAKREQYIAEEIAAEARIVLRRVAYQEDLPYLVVLTARDINNPPFNHRFYFKINFSDLAIVSTARMDPRSYGEPWDRDLLYRRFKKMVKKAIGHGYFRYPLSTDTNSVMYSPIMSLQDLDDMGEKF